MKTYYKYIILLAGCFFALAVSAQNLNLVSPITISMPNNPVANTDDWGKGAQLFVITAKKNTPNELQSWMLVTIKKGGSKVCGSNTLQTAPEVYFDIPLKTWVGANAVSLLGNGCILQPGDYELCVQFYLKDRRTIIGENCKSFTIKETKPESYAPPQNILPAADKILTAQEVMQPLQFRWTPIVPKPKAKVKYTVRIWEIPISSSKSQVIKTQPPIVIKETIELTQLTIAPSEFKQGKSENNAYAWNVEASKTSAMGDIEMLGTSEATEFSVRAGDADPVKYSPPVNQLPSNAKILTDKEAELPVQFKWTPVLPRPKEDIIYILRIFEVSAVQPKIGSQSGGYKSNVKRSDGSSYKVIEVKNETETTVQLSKNIKGLYWEVEAISTQKQQGEKPQNFGKSEATSVFIKTQSFTLLTATPGTFGEYPCNTQTTFGSSLICGQGYPSAYVNYSVYTSSNILVSSVNVAPGAAATFTTPTIAGDYNFVIASICGNDTLHKIVRILKIRCTPNAVTNCCQKSSWGTMLQYTNGGLSTEPLPPCGRNLGVLECGSTKKLKVCYNCNVDCKTTTAQIKYEIFKAGVLQNTSIVSSCSAANINIPNASGSYSLVITSICGDSVCNTCTYYFQTACASGCDCKSVQCTKKLWYKDVSTGIIKEFTCINQTPIVLNCDKNYQFFADTKCSPDTNCKMIVKGEFRNAAGALVIQQTPFNSTSSAFNIISGTPGNYTFTIRYYINDVECGNCTIPITINCTPSVDCCKNSSWVLKYENSNGRIGVPVVLPACGTKLSSVECNIEKEYFITYACAQGCGPAQARFQYYNAATNAPVGIAVNAPTQNQTHIFTPGTAGNYYLKIEVFCGGKLCDSCKYPVEVKCTPPVNCCQNATQKDPSVYDTAGSNLATFSCTQPKTYYINAANKNCDKDLVIKASTNCGSNANCQAKIVYTLVKTGTSATITGTGILTIPASLANGTYTLTVDYYCGNSICKTCKFEIIKDCPPVVDDCCKNSSWGEKIHYTSGGFTGRAVPKPLPASGSNLGVVNCGSTKQFKICYNCAQGCGAAQIKYDVYMAYSLVLVSSTTVASCSVANITMPATAGNYQIRIAAICNGKECNAMDYFINTECKPVDCCKGGKWTNKSLDWDIKIKVEQAEGTELSNDPVKKSIPQNKKDKKTPAGAKIKPVDIGGGQLNPLSGSLKVANCSDTLKINEGNEFTFNAAYTCNAALANCTGKVIAKVKDPNGVTYGTWPLPHLFNFATAGVYTVTYYTYCGETVCDSCTFYVNAAKDCCKDSEWKKAQYQVTNKKPNGDWDKTDKTYYSLPFTITSHIPVIKADVAIDLEKLEFSCAQGCTSGFILKRKNITTGVEETPEIIAVGGTPSLYAKAYPQLITIIPTCGGISCGKPIVFRLECLNKDCCVSDTIVFSTGISANGTVATGTEPQWYAPYPLKILSPGIAPFFGSGGAATILQDVVDVDNITSYTASRNITVSKNCNISFSGKLGIAKYNLHTWGSLFKSFKLHKGSAAGPVVWTHVSGTPGTVGTYVTNNFNGTVAATPGVYTFVFEYIRASPSWKFNSMFVTGIIVGNILPTSKDCCPSQNTGNTGIGNTTTYSGPSGNVNGLNLDMDTCSCNGGRWEYGFEWNGGHSGWQMLNYSPPYTFNQPPNVPFKLGLVYICNQNWNCTFNVKLIKKNLTTNIETVVVSENDIISGPTSLFNHSALRTWLYPENDICQYTIIPYCNGKVCGDRLVFNIKKMIFPGAKQIGGNTTADKGWDGHISAGKITFPPNCFAIFCPTGSVGVDGKCVPLVTTLDGSYAISDGMLNGKKELMRSEELNNIVGRYLQYGVKYQFKGAVIKNIDAVPNVVAVYYNEAEKTIQTIVIPLINKKGYLKMQGISTLITQVGDKQTISMGPNFSSNKQKLSISVGHTVLLK